MKRYTLKMTRANKSKKAVTGVNAKLKDDLVAGGAVVSVVSPAPKVALQERFMSGIPLSAFSPTDQVRLMRGEPVEIVNLD